MSITDELREWWVRKFPVMDSELHKNFTAIADRIDAEYQKAIRELNNLADASVLLPRDADGVLICVGDVLDGYGKTIEVVEMRHGRSGWVLISRDGNGYADTFAFAHHHEPTVEDVLRDVVTLCHNTWKEGSAFEFYDVDDVMESGNIAEFAARLRLAKEDE